MVRCSTTSGIFSGGSSSTPLSSFAAPFLCPRYRPSYPTRGCANYIGGRESASRPTIEIACRLSAWPPHSHFHPHPFLLCSPFPPSPPRYILFPSRVLFHRRQQTIQAPRRRPRRNDNKVVGKAIVPAWRSGRRAFLVSEVARRLLYDRRTSAATTTTKTTTRGRCRRGRRDFVEICLPPRPSFSLQRSFILSFPFLFAISRSAHYLAMHANARA